MGSFWFNTFFSYIVGVGNVYIGNSSNIASSLTFNENTVPALLVIPVFIEVRNPTDSSVIPIDGDVCIINVPVISFHNSFISCIYGGCISRDHMVVRFTTTYAISAYHYWCEFESRSGQGIQHYVIKFVWLVTCQWFSPSNKQTSLDNVRVTISFGY